MGLREDGTGGFVRTEVMEVQDMDGNLQRWYLMVRPERSYTDATPVVECGSTRGPLTHSVNRTAVEYTGCAPKIVCGPGGVPEYTSMDWAPAEDFDMHYDREVH